MMNKLPAFTIMELAAVMIVSMLVISIAYSSLTILSKQYHNFKGANDEVVNITLLDRLLLKDFDNCNIVIKSDEGLSFIFNTKQVDYLFRSDFVLRRDIIPDTFFITQGTISTRFFHTSEDIPGKLVDELLFSFANAGNDTIRLLCLKRYGADILMEFDEQNQSN